MRPKNVLVATKMVGVIVALSLATSACTQAQKSVQGVRAIPVKLKTLERATLIDSSEYVGTLEAQNRVNLAPRINGRILKIFVQEGERVSKGQPIVLLEPTQQQEQVNAAAGQVNVNRANFLTAQAQLREQQASQGAAENTVAQRAADVANAQAALSNQLAQLSSRQAELSSREADLREAQANLELAQKNYQRSQFLVGEGVEPQQNLDNNIRDLKTAQENVESRRKVRDASKSAVDQAKASVQQAQANVQAAKEALNVARKNLLAAEERVKAAQFQVDSQNAAIASAEGQLGAVGQDLVFNTVKAPVDGVVGDFNQKKIGDIVNIGETITTITNNQTFLLNVNIPVEYYSRLQKGIPVEIINRDGSKGVRGEITYVAPLVEQNAQAILTKMTFRNDGSLRDEQYVRVRVIWEEKPGVLVPTTAVTSLGSQQFVFVAQKGKTKEQEDILVAKQVPLKVGTIQGQAYQVISGVKAGDRIAVSRILDLRDNTPITEESIQGGKAFEQ